jgi:hypothetical protein
VVGLRAVQKKKENNQTLFTSGLTTKDADECDFGTGNGRVFWYDVTGTAPFLERQLV